MEKDEVRRRLVADGVAMVRWSIFGGHDEGCLIDAQTFDKSGTPTASSITLEQLETFGSEHAMKFVPGFGTGPAITYGWFVWVVEQNEVYLLEEGDTSIWNFDEREICDGIEIYLTDPKFLFNDRLGDDGESFHDFYINVRNGNIAESAYQNAFELVKELVSLSRKNDNLIVALDFDGLKRLASEVDYDLEFDNCYISLDWNCSNLCSQGVFDGKYFRLEVNGHFECILVFFDASDLSLRDPINDSCVVEMNPNPTTLIKRAESLGPLK